MKKLTFVGTYRPPCLKWIKEKLLYNIPVSGNLQDALRCYSACTHLWLIAKGEEDLHYALTNPKLISLEDLRNLGYPVRVNPHADNYVLFELVESINYEKESTNYAFILEDYAKDKNKVKIVNDFLKAKVEKTDFAEKTKVEKILPEPIFSAPSEKLRVCVGSQMNFLDVLFSVKKTNDNTLKAIDLFAGIGGIRMGFDRAFKDDIETTFVCEWDKFAQKTYTTNFNDTFEIAGDITKVDEKDIPSFDICLAGFPCQAFSLAGQRMGFEDNYKGKCRGTLFLDVARICEYHKPKVIFCENVKGLVIHDKGRTFKIICKTFEDLGYKVFYKVLNSKDFGVPQNRERIYVVAFRNDIAPKNFEFPKKMGSTKTLMDIQEENPVPARYYLSDVYVDTLRRHKARHAAKGNGFGYEIRDWNNIAGAIVCGGMGRERNLVVDFRQTNLKPTTHIKGAINKEGIRKMTPREWARLQGFPDSFKLELADTHLYKQFGNSVTVNVIEAIAKKIREVLKNS